MLGLIPNLITINYSWEINKHEHWPYSLCLEYPYKVLIISPDCLQTHNMSLECPSRPSALVWNAPSILASQRTTDPKYANKNNNLET